MKVIKFRIWDNLKKGWVSNKHIWRMRTDENGVGDILPSPVYWKQHPDGLTYQQFTGLTDKNGRDIYEGDIVRQFHDFIDIPYREWIGVIEWHADEMGGIIYNGFRVKTEEIGFRIHSNCEVIGNILENGV